jgi:predicted nucleic acid-binding protein
MGWVAPLHTHLIGCDTAPLIYYIETHPIYLQLIDLLFDSLDRGELQLVTSTITLLEVLIHPLRQGNAALAQHYEILLSNTRGIHVAPVSFSIAQAAARIRATYNLRTPDALQIATAIEFGAQFFVTNDPIFKRVPHINVIILDDLLQNAGGQSATP